MNKINKEKKQELSTYNILHKLERFKNYNLNGGDTNTVEQNTDFAHYLNKNFDNMDEIEIGKFLVKCLGPIDIKKQLFAFEFEHNTYDHIKNMTLVEFTEKALKLINRYQWKAGGYLIEDNEWIIHKSNSDSSDYNIKKYEVLFENTLDKSDLNDEETYNFINQLLNHLNSFCDNIKVEFKQKIEKRIVKLLLWFVDTTQVPDEDAEYSSESIGL
jgi:hypothetical protein